jgi:hypothetical protein
MYWPNSNCTFIMNINFILVVNRCLKDFQSQTQMTTLKVAFASNKPIMKDFQLRPFHIVRVFPNLCVVQTILMVCGAWLCKNENNLEVSMTSFNLAILPYTIKPIMCVQKHFLGYKCLWSGTLDPIE